MLPYKILRAVLQNLTVKDCLKVEFHLVNKIGIFILKYTLLVKKALPGVGFLQPLGRF